MKAPLYGAGVDRGLSRAQGALRPQAPSDFIELCLRRQGFDCLILGLPCSAAIPEGRPGVATVNDGAGDGIEGGPLSLG